jgi:hypothetical protein
MLSLVTSDSVFFAPIAVFSFNAQHQLQSPFGTLF